MRNIIVIFLFILLSLFVISQNKEQETILGISELLIENELFEYPEDYSEFNQQPILEAGEYGTYDFIIIGAGSAGTVLSNRLSETPNWRILLLEAGEDDGPITDIPAMAGLLQRSKYNWGYKTVPQRYCCLGMIDKKCYVPRGKVLGGSSTINYMIYTRGNKADFDKWSNDGNPGWSYDEILPYFIKMENSSLSENVEKSYHGHNGTFSIEHVKNFGDLGQAFLDGQKELGNKILDYNGENQIGSSRVQTNTINGKRCSGNKAFLQPISNRKNLKIVKNAFVTKILTNNDKEVAAWGVEFLVKHRKYIAKTTKEIILSAGAIGSPQILMHSGIGPEEELSKLGIKSVAELPVGKNLHDHPVFVFPFATNFTEPGLKAVPEIISDYLKGYGYFTSAGNIQTISFINTKDKLAFLPNIEQLLSAFFDLSDSSLSKIFNFETEVTEKYIKPYGRGAPVYCQILTHGKSRGSIRLKSKNIFDHPLIDLNFFENDEDIQIMIEGFKEFLSLLDTKAMKKFNATYLYNPIPQCPQKFMSDEYLECLLRHTAASLYHLAGTCKMGPKEDSDSVVDHQLKVKGVGYLRVVDASVIPSPIASHTNAPTHVIGHKASDMILKEWQSTIDKVDSCLA